MSRQGNKIKIPEILVSTKSEEKIDALNKGAFKNRPITAQKGNKN